jgi:hypothetical protein
MPSRKQRRRQEKLRRHDYVYEDEEGREIEPAELRAARPKADKTESRGRAQTRSGRPVRQVPPPSWSRVIKRAALFGPIMFFVIWSTSKRYDPTTRILIAAAYTVAFLPIFYLTDRLAYRAYLRRTGRGDSRPKNGKPT